MEEYKLVQYDLEWVCAQQHPQKRTFSAIVQDAGDEKAFLLSIFDEIRYTFFLQNGNIDTRREKILEDVQSIRSYIGDDRIYYDCREDPKSIWRKKIWSFRMQQYAAELNKRD